MYSLLSDASELETSKSNNLGTFRDNFEELTKPIKKQRSMRGNRRLINGETTVFVYDPNILAPPMIRVRFGSPVVDFGTLAEDGKCDIFYSIGGADNLDQMLDRENPPRIPLVYFPGETSLSVTVKAKAVRMRDGKVSDISIFVRHLDPATTLPMPKVTLDQGAMTVSINPTVTGAHVYYSFTGAPTAPTQSALGQGGVDESLIPGALYYNPSKPYACQYCATFLI